MNESEKSKQLTDLLHKLECEYGWTFYDENKKIHLTEMQQELIEDIMNALQTPPKQIEAEKGKENPLQQSLIDFIHTEFKWYEQNSPDYGVIPQIVKKWDEIKLQSLPKERKKDLITSYVNKSSELGDELCQYCNLDKKGVYGVDGGYVAGCEGSKCNEAYDNYLEQINSIEKKSLPKEPTPEKCEKCPFFKFYKESTWDDNKVIDFVNWYLRMCKVITDQDCRFELENRTVIESFLKGDDYKLWWNDEAIDKMYEGKEPTPELICMEQNCTSKATKDYNGCGHWVCDRHYDKLSDEFDEEYK